MTTTTTCDSLTTDLALDRNPEKRVRLNFNITMMDLKCDYAVVDVVSVLGTEQNVSAHITKWHVDGAGVRQQYQGRNKEQRDILLHDHAITESIEELLEDREEAISLDSETFNFALQDHTFVFVDFYASCKFLFVVVAAPRIFTVVLCMCLPLWD